MFGAYNNGGWEDYLGYQGDNECFLFQLKQNPQAFFTFQGEGQQNYLYFNTKKIVNSKYRQGIGFGGDADYKDFRIWVDSEVMSNSYSYENNKTYGKGNLTLGPDNPLPINQIQVFGLGSEQDLK